MGFDHAGVFYTNLAGLKGGAIVTEKNNKGLFVPCI
jgi:hypothetical protein